MIYPGWVEWQLRQPRRVREWKKVVKTFETIIFQFVNETMSKGKVSG